MAKNKDKESLFSSKLKLCKNSLEKEGNGCSHTPVLSEIKNHHNRNSSINNPLASIEEITITPKKTHTRNNSKSNAKTFQRLTGSKSKMDCMIVKLPASHVSISDRENACTVVPLFSNNSNSNSKANMKNYHSNKTQEEVSSTLSHSKSKPSENYLLGKYESLPTFCNNKSKNNSSID